MHACRTCSLAGCQIGVEPPVNCTCSCFEAINHCSLPHPPRCRRAGVLSRGWESVKSTLGLATGTAKETGRQVGMHASYGSVQPAAAVLAVGGSLVARELCPSTGACACCCPGLCPRCSSAAGCLPCSAAARHAGLLWLEPGQGMCPPPPSTTSHHTKHHTKHTHTSSTPPHPHTHAPAPRTLCLSSAGRRRRGRGRAVCIRPGGRAEELCWPELGRSHGCCLQVGAGRSVWACSRGARDC